MTHSTKQVVWAIIIGMAAGLIFFHFAGRTHADTMRPRTTVPCPTENPATGVTAYINCVPDPSWK